MDSQLIVIGKIVSVHGLTGNLKVYSYAESFETFERLKSVYLKTQDRYTEYEIRWVNPYKKNVVLLSLKDVNDRSDSEQLIAKELYVDKENLPDLEEDSFYFHDLIGLDVFDKGDFFIGKIESILQTGSNDVYIVSDNGNEILVPAIESVILKIDLNKKKMTVDLPEGL